MNPHLTALACVLTLAAGIAPAATPPTDAAPPLSAERAAAIAVNRLVPTADGVMLHHPRRTVEFAPEGVRLTSRRGAPEWRWSLDAISTAGGRLVADSGPTVPVAIEQDLVRYDRCAVLEDYRLKADSLEQLFVIPAPLGLAGENLVVSGAVACDGDLAETGQGWAWQTARGEVTLGRVTVLDDAGSSIPARFEVSERATRIVVDGDALAAAAYPVTIDPEIGTNDFRISDMGPDGNRYFRARTPKVAYNATMNQYLVVWAGDDDTGGLVQGEREIFGQILSAEGIPIGLNDFRISDVGGTGDPTYDADYPDVVWNSGHNQYLVVWHADDPRTGTSDEEREIYGQILDHQGGELHANDFRISSMGPEGDPTFSAEVPSVAYNSSRDEFLVVWHGETNSGGVEDEFEIFGRLVSWDGDQDAPTFRVSFVGLPLDPAYDAGYPDVAYNSSDDEYLVVWYGEDDEGGLIEGEREIFGQRLNSNGDREPPNDYRISEMGGTGNLVGSVEPPAVAYNSDAHEYLVAWSGYTDVGGPVPEHEIFVQRLAPGLAELGITDQRISDIGGIGVSGFNTRWDIDVAYQPYSGDYAIVWSSNDMIGDLDTGEFEVYYQFVSSEGLEIGINDWRLSDIGDIGDDTYNTDLASPVAVAANSSNGEFLAVWSADDPVDGLVDDEFEIFGQLWFALEIFISGLDSGDTSGWSLTVP
jgi:hypothetical protein